MYLYAAYMLYMVCKMHVDTRINIPETWKSPPANSSDRHRVLSAAAIQLRASKPSRIQTSPVAQHKSR